MRRLLVLLTLIVATAGALAANASADYGPGTQFQVAISANNLDGGNFWFWAALGPGQESDYQNTDCIHTTAGGNPPKSGGQTGAAHTSGQLTSWSDNGGVIEMDGVSIIGGLATADYFISDAGHSTTFTLIVTWEAAPILPLGVPLTFSGHAVNVQVAAHP